MWIFFYKKKVLQQCEKMKIILCHIFPIIMVGPDRTVRNHHLTLKTGKYEMYSTEVSRAGC